MIHLIRICVFGIICFVCNYLNIVIAQPFSLINIPQHAASYTVSPNCSVTITSGGGGTQQWQGTSIGTGGIVGTAGSAAQGCADQTGLRLEMSGAGNSSGTGTWNNSITVTFIFQQGVKGPVTFTIFDFTEPYWNDGTFNYAYYQDKVTVTSTKCDGTSITPTLTINNGPISSSTVGSSLIITANQLQGACLNEPISIGTPTDLIREVTVVYSNQDPPTNIPSPGTPPRYGISQYQYVFISDINASPPDLITVSAMPNPICIGETVTLSASSAASYTYSWASGTTPTTGTPVTATPVVTTTYTVTGTIGTCAQTNSVTVNVNTGTLPTFTPLGPYCIGESPGSLQSTSLNGFTGTWSPATISTASPGTTVYTFTPTAGQCATTQTLSITVNSTATANAGTDQTICSGQSATLTATGGPPYSWNTGQTTAAITVGPAATTSYTVTVGSGGCTASDIVTINVNTIPAANAGTDQTICAGQSTTLTATGGGTYQWNSGSVLQSISVNPGSTTTYTVTVTNNGCSASDDVLVTVSPLPSANAGSDQIICPGQSAILTATGGGTYSWSNSSTSATITVSPATTSTYTVTVTNNGCTASDDVIITIGSSLTAEAGPDQTICSGGTATLTASGGSTYLWNNSEATASITVSPISTSTYTVTVSSGSCSGTDNVTVNVNSIPAANAGTDQTICSGQTTTISASGGGTYQWDNGSVLQTISVNPGSTTTFTVTVTNNGCSASDNVQVTVNSVPTADAGPDLTICPAGSVSINGSGGGAYTWSTGETTPSISVSPASTTTYTLTVINNGCSASDEVVVSISNNATIIVTPSDPSICPGDNVQLTASGAVNYNWSPSSSLSSSTGTTVTASPVATTTYTVIGSDGLGCSGSSTVTVNVNPLTATITSTDENCGQVNGTSTVTPSGICGTGYLYTWNSSPPQNTQTAINLPAGTYTVTINCGGCMATASATIANLPGPVSSISNITNTFCGLPNGSATVNISGGTAPYSYQWNTSPVQTSQTLSNVSAGTYIMNVTDINNCSVSDTVIIIDQPGPSVTITNTINASCDQANGTATANATGGASPLTYTWSTTPVQAGQTLLNVDAGTYTVTVTDVNGCTDTAQVSISQNGGPLATISFTNDACGLGYGTATVTAFQGTGNYTYLWSTNPPQNTATATGLTEGTYTVTVDDGNCTTTATATIFNQAGPSANFSVAPDTIHLMEGSVHFVSYSHGDNLSYEWIYGDGTSGYGENSQHEYSETGTFYVTLIVTDENGCTDSISLPLVVIDIFTVYIPNVFTPDDDGRNDFFFPQGLGWDPADFEFLIFNRWGNLVFESSDINDKWNGTLFNSGNPADVAIIDVYVYKIHIKELYGKPHDYIGRVTLLR